MKENKQQAQSRLEGGKGKAKVELLRFEGKGGGRREKGAPEIQIGSLAGSQLVGG